MRLLTLWVVWKYGTSILQGAASRAATNIVCMMLGYTISRPREYEVSMIRCSVASWILRTGLINSAFGALYGNVFITASQVKKAITEQNRTVPHNWITQESQTFPCKRTRHMPRVTLTHCARSGWKLAGSCWKPAPWALRRRNDVETWTCPVIYNSTFKNDILWFHIRMRDLSAAPSNGRFLY